MKSVRSLVSVLMAMALSLAGSMVVLAQQAKPAVTSPPVNEKIHEASARPKKKVGAVVRASQAKAQAALETTQKQAAAGASDAKHDVVQQAKTEAAKLPATTKVISTEKAQLAGEGKREAGRLKSTLDTARHPRLKQKATTAIRSEKEQVKQTISSYKSGFKVSRFSDLKIDTGEVPLEKEGLLKRGQQFVKSNTSGTELPSSIPGRLSDFKAEQFLKPLSPAALTGKADKIVDNIETSAKKIEAIEKGNVNADQLSKDMRKLADKVETPDSKRLSKASETVDKVLQATGKDVFNKGNLGLGDLKKVYSEKYKKKIIDSLGLQKADSMLQIAAPLLKQEVSKEELLESINNSFGNKAKVDGVGFNTQKETLNVKDAETFKAMPDQFSGGDLSKLKLPQGVLQELPPLRGDLVDKKYVHIIDSMKRVNLKVQNLKMNENELTSKIKSIVVQEKPGFFDKSYVELILGFYQTNNFTVFQASPSFAYHVTEHLSTGIGPAILVKVEEKKKLNALLGFRYYAKLELYKRRVYLQVEDNVNPSALNRETLQTSVHSVLAGGGVLLPLSKTLALNPCLLYRINTDHTSASGQSSPWVFRLGISSLKLKK